MANRREARLAEWFLEEVQGFHNLPSAFSSLISTA
jgi:hypothetical protein